MKKEKALVVTTVYKGVFFGYAVPTMNTKTIRLTNARMCVYWSSNVKGVLGLAANGPTAGCKIGPAVPAITINEITSIIECSDKAIKRWNLEPWA